ncbi:response regulator transcription factor [Gordonia sp. ABSL11-1]|uniref:LuxR C-terminal-related transcriptional regulator n=1 Tax=Gordonia sp. ABSL11-1 TaxID=3053924 RepID=UPI00257455E8|nr:response regulator transcription factor [Gordonia sp. ABSL11-1]MDL9944913.1 response regulator transcription factor [Gordonia sp. ABSL11-1]
MTPSAPAVVRVGMVDDHPSPVWGVERILDRQPDLELVCSSATVGGLLQQGVAMDIVILDLRLDDGTSPGENVTRLTEAGVGTVVYTSGEHPSLLRSAARAGTLGVVLKSASEQEIVDAIRAAAAGREVLTTEWAAAIDGDPELEAVDLSPQLQRVLTLYASGETSAGVGAALGVTAETVNEYLKRIRQKYAAAGRPTRTKLDLFKRAVEDGWLPVPGRNASSAPNRSVRRDAPRDPGD